MLFFDVVDHFEAFHSVSNKFGPVGAVLGHLEPFWTTPFGTIVAHSVPFFLRIFPQMLVFGIHEIQKLSVITLFFMSSFIFVVGKHKHS